MKKVSVIIAVQDSIDNLQYGLRSVIRNITFLQKEFEVEILVVNDGLSSNNSSLIRIIEACCDGYDSSNIKLLSSWSEKEPNYKLRNFGIPYNMGIKEATGDIVILMSPGIVCQLDGLYKMVEGLSEKELIEPSYIYLDMEDKIRNLEAVSFLLGEANFISRTRKVESLCTRINTIDTFPFFAIYKKELQEICGFDEDFISTDNFIVFNDLRERLHQNGCTFTQKIIRAVNVNFKGTYLDNSANGTYDQILYEARRGVLVRNNIEQWR